MKYYSALKRNEIDTCYNMAETSQTQKNKYCMIPLIYELPRVVKFIETEIRTVGHLPLG